MDEYFSQLKRLILLFIPLSFVLGIFLGPIIYLGIAISDENITAWDYSSPFIMRVIRFTFLQAFLSAFITVSGALLVGWYFFRYRFFGKNVLKIISLIPYALPTIVVGFSFIIAYGRSGYINNFLALFGQSWTFIYNQWAIIAANVFFNLGISARGVEANFAQIPTSLWAQANILNFSKWNTFCYVVWPYLRKPLFNYFLMTLSLSLSTFGLALVLGGGPRFSTIEVAIYQALRIDFDIAKAGYLAIIQFCLTILIALPILIFSHQKYLGRVSTAGSSFYRDCQKLPLLGKFILSLYAIFHVVPLISLVWDGLSFLWVESFDFLIVWQSLNKSIPTTLFIAVCSTVITVAISLLISWQVCTNSNQWPRLVTMMKLLNDALLGISPVVLSLGFFIIFYTMSDPLSHALWVIPILHGMLAYPFAIRIILPAMQDFVSAYHKQIALFEFSFLKIVFEIFFPAIIRPIAISGMLAFSFSLGDISVVSIFSAADLETLPLAIYSLMGTYHYKEAAFVTLILFLASLACFIAGEHWLRDRRKECEIDRS